MKLTSRRILTFFASFLCLLSVACSGAETDASLKPEDVSLKDITNVSISDEKLAESCDARDVIACAKLGMKQLEVGNDAEGVVTLNKACEANVIVACHSIGFHYANQIYSDEQAAQKSEQFYRMACSGGYADSCFDLAMFFRVSSLRNSTFAGVDVSMENAATLFQAGCDLEHHESCRMLAGSYYDGEGVPKDTEAAIGLYSDGCENGNAGSCSFLGTAYYDGQNVEKDTQKGFELMSKACELGDRIACSNVHSIHIKQCDQRVGENCFEAAKMYEAGQGHAYDFTDSAREESASKYFTKACELGAGENC